jgi:hypothetical protein
LSCSNSNNNNNKYSSHNSNFNSESLESIPKKVGFHSNCSLTFSANPAYTIIVPTQTQTQPLQTYNVQLKKGQNVQQPVAAQIPQHGVNDEIEYNNKIQELKAYLPLLQQSLAAARSKETSFCNYQSSL